jgi:hypothetical protein
MVCFIVLNSSFFTTQTRGIPSGDIIQEIRTSSGQLLQTKIGYDNKEAKTLTIKEVKTDYFIIISKNLPKKDIKNGLCGEKDGVLEICFFAYRLRLNM